MATRMDMPQQAPQTTKHQATAARTEKASPVLSKTDAPKQIQPKTETPIAASRESERIEPHVSPKHNVVSANAVVKRKPIVRQVSNNTEEVPVVVREVTRTPEPIKQGGEVISVQGNSAPASSNGIKFSPTSNRPDKIAMLEEIEKGSKKPAEPSGVSTKSVFSTLLKLGVVLALAYVTILALKLLSNKKPVMSGGSQEMKITDTVRLSQNSSLHIINVKGKSLLIASSAGQVNLIQEFEAEQEQVETAQVPGGKFAEYLAKYSESSGNTTPASRVAGLLRDCTDHLRKMKSTSRLIGSGNRNDA